VKTSNMHRILSAAVTGLALAAITQVSYAARDVASETQVAPSAENVQVTPSNTIDEPRRAGRGSPLTLYVEDSSGNAFRLIHIEGTGWKYAEGWKTSDHGGKSLFRKMAFWSTTATPPVKQTVADDEPLTVFIDGPSGFTFVWNRNDGWKFVGKISNKRS
jgi:hypothetical protein